MPHPSHNALTAFTCWIMHLEEELALRGHHVRVSGGGLLQGPVSCCAANAKLSVAGSIVHHNCACNLIMALCRWRAKPLQPEKWRAWFLEQMKSAGASPDRCCSRPGLQCFT